MTRELLLTIINQKLFLDIALIIITYLIYWIISLKLCLQILEIKASIKKLVPAIFIMFIYSLAARLIIPRLLFGIIEAFLIAILLTFIAPKVSYLKYLWSAFLSILISGISSITALSVLSFLNPNISTFFLKATLGMPAGTILEVIVPSLVLFILPRLKKKLPLVPPIEKIGFYDIIGVITFGSLFYIVYYEAIKFASSLKDDPQYAFKDMISLWIAAIAAVTGHYTVVRNLKKKNEYEQLQREQEQQKHESDRLIYEERIAQLEQENQELAGLNEQLQTNTIDPREAVAAMQDIIKRLQNAAKSTMERSEKAVILEKISNPAPVYLSPREKDVITSIACGLSNKAIAAALDLTEGTVKNIITKLLEKLELETRSQLAVYAARNGLIDNRE